MRQLCAANQSESIDRNAIITQSILRINDCQIIKTESPDAPQPTGTNTKSMLLGLFICHWALLRDSIAGRLCRMHNI
jgi:hypothetical protein